MEAEHCMRRCKFYGSWALQMWILWELSFGNVNLMRAEHWKSEFVRAGHEYEFDEHWVLWMLINNSIIMRADHCECEFYES